MKRYLSILFLFLLGAGAAHADSATARVGLTKPTLGSTGWGTKVNANYDLLDSTMAALAQSNMFTGVNVFNGKVSFKGPEPWVDVKTLGAAGDGLTDDTSVIQAYVSAASGGYTLYFSSGVYLLNNLQFTAKNNIHLVGSPGAIVRWGGTDAIMTFSTCTRVLINDLEIDNRNVVDQYSGVRFYACQKVWLDSDHVYDSNVSTSGSNDRYAFVFGVGTQQSADLYITRNKFEDLQLEVDYSSRVVIMGNISVRSKRTCAIGAFSVNDGVTATDYTIADNIIMDPQSNGISVVIDPATQNNTTFKRFKIQNNWVVFTTTDTRRAISIGTLDNSQTNSGNVFQDFDITGNRVEYVGGGTGLEALYLNASATSNFYFQRFSIRDNKVIGTGSGTCYDIRRIGQSVFTGNYVYNCGTGYNLSSSTGSNMIYANYSSSCTTPWAASSMLASDTILAVSTMVNITSGGFMGLNSTAPARALDIFDSANPQLRLTQSINSKYADLQADSNGNLLLKPQNSQVTITGIVSVSNAGSTANSFSSTGADNSHTFTIGGARYATIVINSNSNASSPGDASIRLQDNGTHKAEIGIDQSDSDKLKLYGAGSAAGFGTDGAGITIDSSNNVGVDTVSPQDKLSIAGSNAMYCVNASTASGATTATFGTASPATTAAAFAWVQGKLCNSNGTGCTTIYFPVWK